MLDRLQQSAQSVRQALFDAAELPAGAASSSAAAPARQAWNTLRQNLRLESDALRHALRVGIGATLAVALSRSFAVNHGYWMSLTLVFILQPYFAATWQRTVERVLGSVAGAIGASLLGLLLSTPLSVALAVLPIALGTFAARTVNYALFTFFLTSQFVLVSHIQQPDLHEPELAALRAFNSVLGAVLALLIGFLLWPRRRPQPARWRARCSDMPTMCWRSSWKRAARRRSRRGASSSCAGRPAWRPTMPRRHWNGCSRTLHRDSKVDTAETLLNAMRRVTAAGTVLEIQPALPADSEAASAARLRRNPGAGAAPARRRTGTRRPGHAGAVGGGSGATRSAAPGTHRPPGAAGAAATRQAPAGLVLAPDGAN